MILTITLSIVLSRGRSTPTLRAVSEIVLLEARLKLGWKVRSESLRLVEALLLIRAPAGFKFPTVIKSLLADHRVMPLVMVSRSFQLVFPKPPCHEQGTHPAAHLGVRARTESAYAD